MSPGPENEESRPRQGGPSSSSVTSRSVQRMPQVRPAPSLHAVATATLVTSRTGTRRWLLVYRCPGCPSYERHLAQAKSLQDVMVRRTACGHGTVALHVALGQVAA